MQTLNGEPLPEKITKLLNAGETVTLTVRPLRVHARGQSYTLPLLLVTDRRMVIAKDRLFGGKLDFDFPWSAVESLEGGPGMSARSVSLRLILRTGEVGLHVSAEHAVEVDAAIRHQLSRRQ